jgi:hypothetical protein
MACRSNPLSQCRTQIFDMDEGRKVEVTTLSVNLSGEALAFLSRIMLSLW